MKTCMQMLLCALALIVTSHLTRAANIIWTNTAGGNWSVTNNWSPHQAPGSGDIAVITNDANYTVTLDASFVAGGLVLGTTNGINTQVFLINGQTFTLNGVAVIGASGRFTLTNNDVLVGNVVLHGALGCSGGTLSGALTISSNGVLNLGAAGMILDTFYGGIGVLTNYGTVNWGAGSLYCNNSPVIYNYGLWDAQADNTFFGRQYYGNTIINNYGTFRKSGGAGTSYVDVNTTFNTSGTVDVQTGTVQIEGGTGSGTLNIEGGATASYGTRYLFMGSNVVSGSGMVVGFLIGSNAVFSGAVNCSGDTLSGALTISSNGVLNLGAAAVILDTFYGGIGVLTNYGTVNWGGGNLYCNNSPVIYNYGLWDAQADNTFFGRQYYGNTIINNYGTFRKSGGAGTSYVDVNTTFNTSGTVDVQTGTVQIEGGTGSGTLNVEGGATASYGTRYLFMGSNVVSGSGMVVGFLIGSNAVFSGAVNCSGDTLSGALTISSNGVLNLGAAAVILDTFYGGIGVLTNCGTVNWGAGSLYCNNSPVIYNYGLWDAQADNTFFGRQYYGSAIFNNYGTFRKSGGAGTSDVDANTAFSNSGTVDIRTGTLGLNGSHSLTGGTLNFGINNSNSFGTVYLNGSAALTGALNVQFNNGYLPAQGATSFPLVSYGSLSGTFTTLNLPSLPSKLIWQTNYGATIFTLSVITVPSPQLSASPSSIQGGTNFSLTFGTVPGQTYQVQYTTNLAPADWIDLGDSFTATNSTMTILDFIGLNPQRFYRVILP